MNLTFEPAKRTAFSFLLLSSDFNIPAKVVRYLAIISANSLHVPGTVNFYFDADLRAFRVYVDTFVDFEGSLKGICQEALSQYLAEVEKEKEKGW